MIAALVAAVLSTSDPQACFIQNPNLFGKTANIERMSDAGYALDVVCTGAASSSSGGDGKILDGTAAGQADVMGSAPTGTEQGLVTRNIPSGTQPVSGTFWQATQPVSGTFWQATQPVSGTFWQATQPVSESGTWNDQGTKTNNNAAPGATNIGALMCLANAATPAWTEGNLVAESVDLSGNTRVRQRQLASYSAGLTIKTNTAAGITPWFSICGSSTKTLRVQRFYATVTVATAAVYADIVLKKTSTATSAGTATALTKAPHDSNSAASTANAVNYYTVLATAGTSVGVVCTNMEFSPITATIANFTWPSIDCDWRNATENEAIVLRGVAQCLEASFGTTTTNVPTILMHVDWTEE